MGDSFYCIYGTAAGYHGVSPVGNVVVFIPFGMYLAYRKPEMKFGRIVLYGFLLSLAIECMQYVLGTGYTELDDLILNTVGVGVGAKLSKWNKIKFIRYRCFAFFGVIFGLFL